MGHLPVQEKRQMSTTPKPKTPLKHQFQFLGVALLGVLVLLYPMTAHWFSQLNQSDLLGQYSIEVDQTALQERESALTSAREYNENLNSGAAFDPFTQGLAGTDSEPYQEYLSQLEGVPTGVMGRVVIPEIDVDMPIYHGTSEETLLQGVGHLYGTALPVGGEGTHSVLTAHSGLADHRMFTDLPDLEEGDIFTVETYGEQLHYEVIDMQEVLPHETETLVPEAGRDLMTLVTCTPIGVNSHRMLVTGERTDVIDGPEQEYPMQSTVPGFPWWAAILGAAVLGSVVYLWRSNRGGHQKVTDTAASLISNIE